MADFMLGIEKQGISCIHYNTVEQSAANEGYHQSAVGMDMESTL
jgi:hypothetical protein